MALSRKEEHDGVSMLFPESTLFGREKAVPYRMFRAYGNGHGVLSRTGNAVIFLGGSRIIYQKGEANFALQCAG